MSFLTDRQRKELRRLARAGAIQHRFARRANAILLLDRGMSCEEVGSVLFIDDDTVRTWRKLYETGGMEGLSAIDVGGSARELDDDQVESMGEWIDETVPTSTNQVGAWIRRNFDVSYTRSGLVKLLAAAGFVFRKPQVVPRTIDAEAQRRFIREYETLLNGLRPDEAVMFADAVHPDHQSRPAGCWTRKAGPAVAVAANSGRDNVNVHGAIDLSTGATVMLDELRIDATTTIRLLDRIEQRNPDKRRIIVFADHASYHVSNAVKEWLGQAGRRVELRFVPVYCPHLNPIERLWGVMHKHVTHNRCYPSQREFAKAVLTFLRDTVPREFRRFSDQITDNFKIVDPSKYRVLT
jgi:transposase